MSHSWAAAFLFHLSCPACFLWFTLFRHRHCCFFFFLLLFTWTPEKLLNLKFASIDKCRETDTHTGVTCHRSRDWTQAAPYPAYPAGRLTAPQRTASDWGIKHGGQGMCPVGQCASPVCGCVFCLWIRCVFVKLLLGFKFFYSTV